MKPHERAFPDDELSNAIYELHLNTLPMAKAICCQLFGHHDVFDSIMAVFFENGAEEVEGKLGNLMSRQAFLAKNGGLRLAVGEPPPQLHPIFEDLMSRPFCWSGKKATKGIRDARFSILISCGFSMLCFRALEKKDKVAAIEFLAKSEYFSGSCFAYGHAEFSVGSVSTIALKGAATMLANSPKQKEKALVRECWDTWQTSPKNYRSKAAFARDMREKFQNLESQSVIEGWCRAWERESKPSVS